MKAVVKVLIILGLLVAVYALVGRFVCDRSVLGKIIPGGMAAGSLMTGANSLFLLAIIADMLGRKQG